MHCIVFNATDTGTSEQSQSPDSLLLLPSSLVFTWESATKFQVMEHNNTCCTSVSKKLQRISVQRPTLQSQNNTTCQPESFSFDINTCSTKRKGFKKGRHSLGVI